MNITEDAKKLLNKIQSEPSNRQSRQEKPETQTKKGNKMSKKAETTTEKAATTTTKEPAELTLFVEKNQNTDISVGFSEFKGREFLNIRECFLNPRQPGVRNPTRKGITLTTERAGELHEALTKVLKSRNLLA